MSDEIKQAPRAEPVESVIKRIFESDPLATQNIVGELEEDKFKIIKPGEGVLGQEDVMKQFNKLITACAGKKDNLKDLAESVRDELGDLPKTQNILRIVCHLVLPRNPEERDQLYQLMYIVGDQLLLKEGEKSQLDLERVNSDQVYRNQQHNRIVNRIKVVGGKDESSLLNTCAFLLDEYDFRETKLEFARVWVKEQLNPEEVSLLDFVAKSAFFRKDENPPQEPKNSSIPAPILEQDLENKKPISDDEQAAIDEVEALLNKGSSNSEFTEKNPDSDPYDLRLLFEEEAEEKKKFRPDEGLTREERFKHMVIGGVVENMSRKGYQSKGSKGSIVESAGVKVQGDFDILADKIYTEHFLFKFEDFYKDEKKSKVIFIPLDAFEEDERVKRRIDEVIGSTILEGEKISKQWPDGTVAIVFSNYGTKIDNSSRSGVLSGCVLMNSENAKKFQLELKEDPRSLFDLIRAVNGGSIRRFDNKPASIVLEKNIIIFPNTQYGGEISQRISTADFPKGYNPSLEEAAVSEKIELGPTDEGEINYSPKELQTTARQLEQLELDRKAGEQIDDKEIIRINNIFLEVFGLGDHGLVTQVFCGYKDIRDFNLDGQDEIYKLRNKLVQLGKDSCLEGKIVNKQQLADIYVEGLHILFQENKRTPRLKSDEFWSKFEKLVTVEEEKKD